MSNRDLERKGTVKSCNYPNEFYFNPLFISMLAYNTKNDVQTFVPELHKYRKGLEYLFCNTLSKPLTCRKM